MMTLKGIIKMEGKRMKKPATIFQVEIIIDANATRETPKENIICKIIKLLYLKAPKINYFRKV